MVLGGGPLNTLKLIILPTVLLFLFNVHEYCIFNHFKVIFFLNKTVLVLSIMVIFYSKAFKYMCYKKVILDENQNQGF